MVHLESTKKAVLALYGTGAAGSECARQFGVPVATVQYWIRGSGMARTCGETERLQSRAGANKTHHVKLSFSCASPELAWFTGVVFGNGSVADNFVSIPHAPGSVAESLLNVVGTGLYKTDEQSGFGRRDKITFFSAEMADYFRDLLGTDEKKGLAIYFPESLRGFEDHFWRGIVDTDGSIVRESATRCRLRVDSISARLIADYEMYCAARIPEFCKKNFQKNFSKISRYPCFRYSLGYREAMRMLQVVYAASEGMRNETKYSKYLEFLDGAPHVL